VTYKTAWRMFNQIRKLMREELQLGGTGTPGVEMDEMYHGGRRKNEAGRMLKGDFQKKTMVTGIVERKGGRIVARVTPSLTKLAAGTLLKEYVLPETTIFTDESVVFESVPTSRRWATGITASITRKSLRLWRRSHEHD